MFLILFIERFLYRITSLFRKTTYTATAQAVGLTLFSPASYQVFQRDETDHAQVLLAGQVDGLGTVDVEYRIDGGDWQPLQEGVSFRFQLAVVLPVGQYAIDIRAGVYTLSRQYVGVGDVFVIAGQSNASGRGTAPQSYYHPTLKASIYSNAYTWGNLQDWTDNPLNALDAVSSDGTAANTYGSYWPLLASLIMQNQGVPVAFIPCAKGGTSIRQWLPSVADRYDTATLYGAMARRIWWSGGNVRAVLFHLGETDAGNPNIMPPGMYAEYLEELSANIYTDFGKPLIAAKISQQTALPAICTWAINRGIYLASTGSYNVFLGADLADILPDDTAQQHITAPAKLQLCADRWYVALLATVYAV